MDVEKRDVGFIDCDSYQVLGESGVHLCEAVRADFAPVELLARERFNEAPVGAESARFSAGMILFFILNTGNHPYRHKNGEDPVTNLRSGRCALGGGTGCAFPAGPWYAMWKALPYRVKGLFSGVSGTGTGAPNSALRLRSGLRPWRPISTGWWRGVFAMTSSLSRIESWQSAVGDFFGRFFRNARWAAA